MPAMDAAADAEPFAIVLSLAISWSEILVAFENAGAEFIRRILRCRGEAGAESQRAK
jgi:hypothetical protein